MKSTEEKTPQVHLVTGSRSMAARPPRTVGPKAPVKKRTPKASQGKSRAMVRRALRDEALQKYQIDPVHVDLAPKLSAILEESKGGLDAVLDAMRFSNAPTIVAWLAAYDAADDWERRHMPWEGWSLVAGVDPMRLLADIMFALREGSVNLVKILAITNHPDIMRARIKQAKRPEGERDRHALDTMLGALPTPKGPTFIGKFYQAQGAGGPQDDAGVDPKDVDVNDLFTSLATTQKLLGE